jgi:hypothetical protein
MNFGSELFCEVLSAGHRNGGSFGWTNYDEERNQLGIVSWIDKRDGDSNWKRCSFVCCIIIIITKLLLLRCIVSLSTMNIGLELDDPVWIGVKSASK